MNNNRSSSYLINFMEKWAIPVQNIENNWQNNEPKITKVLSWYAHLPG